MKRRSTSLRQRVPDAVSLYGAATLSDAHLVATFLDSNSTDVAEKILHEAGSLAHLIFAGHAHLRAYGMDDHEAARFEVIPELFLRAQKSGDRRPKLLSPIQAITILRPRCLGWAEERFGILALNAKSELVADRILAHGTPVCSVITPKIFFREALRFGAASALAWHNHPDGDPTPNQHEQVLTERLRKAGEMIGVTLADHIIIGGNDNYSFRGMEGWDD